MAVKHQICVDLLMFFFKFLRLLKSGQLGVLC